MGSGSGKQRRAKSSLPTIQLPLYSQVMFDDLPGIELRILSKRLTEEGQIVYDLGDDNGMLLAQGQPMGKIRFSSLPDSFLPGGDLVGREVTFQYKEEDWLEYAHPDRIEPLAGCRAQVTEAWFTAKIDDRDHPFAVFSLIFPDRPDAPDLNFRPSDL